MAWYGQVMGCGGRVPQIMRMKMEYWINVHVSAAGNVSADEPASSRNKAVSDLADGMYTAGWAYLHTLHVKDGVADIINIKDEADAYDGDDATGAYIDKRMDEAKERAMGFGS